MSDLSSLISVIAFCMIFFHVCLLSQLELAGVEVVVSVTREHKDFLCIVFLFPLLVE